MSVIFIKYTTTQRYGDGGSYVSRENDVSLNIRNTIEKIDSRLDFWFS